MPERVRITDVAPRDGLQSESRLVPTDEKVSLVRALAACGVDEVEVSSFVSPKWIPQLADARDVFLAVAPEKPSNVEFSALVPNEKGLDAAFEINQAAGKRVIDKVSVFTAASETFSKRNTNASIAEAIERFRPVLSRARDAGLRTRGYVSCAIACPFEGPIAPAAVADVALRLLDLGIDELDLGDTIGAADPASLRALLETINAHLGSRLDLTPGTDRPTLVLHLHDTFGRAASCVEEALKLGVRWFDGAAGGLGGCPYASTPDRRAPGNIDSGLLYHTIHAAGYATGVNPDRLAEAARVALACAGRPMENPR